jgi:hypothetical protein
MTPAELASQLTLGRARRGARIFLALFRWDQDLLVGLEFGLRHAPYRWADGFLNVGLHDLG